MKWQRPKIVPVGVSLNLHHLWHAMALSMVNDSSMRKDASGRSFSVSMDEDMKDTNTWSNWCSALALACMENKNCIPIIF